MRDVRLVPNGRPSIDENEDLAEPNRSGNLSPSGSQGEFFDELVRDWLVKRKGHTRLGGLEPSRCNVVSTGLDGGRCQIETALLAERCITRDDGFSDPEPRHFVGDDFLGVRQSARELSTQSNQQGAELLRSLSDIGVVISKHRQGTSSLSWHIMAMGNAHRPSINQMYDWVKLRPTRPLTSLDNSAAQA
jgi:hypothetical protein